MICAGILIGCGGGGGSTGFGGSGGGGNPSPQATTTTITSAAVKVPVGTQITVAAKVTGVNKPTGTVDFFANGAWLGTGTVAPDGSVSATISPFYPGIDSVTASYEGDSRNLPSTSAGVNELVTGATSIFVSGQLSTNYRNAIITVNVQ